MGVNVSESGIPTFAAGLAQAAGECDRIQQGVKLLRRQVGALAGPPRAPCGPVATASLAIADARS